MCINDKSCFWFQHNTKTKECSTHPRGCDEKSIGALNWDSYRPKGFVPLKCSKKPSTLTYLVPMIFLILTFGFIGYKWFLKDQKQIKEEQEKAAKKKKEAIIQQYKDMKLKSEQPKQKKQENEQKVETSIAGWQKVGGFGVTNTK